MFEPLIDKFHFISSIAWLLIFWGGVFLTIFAYHRAHSDSLNSLLEIIPVYITNTSLIVLLYVGAIPLLNYAADKSQYGAIVGAARNMSMFSERPFYGLWGFHFIIIAMIILSGFLISRLTRSRY